MPVGYDQDVAAWAAEQARLIRARRFDQLDLEHIADEVEDVGRSERRELASRMTVLLAHCIKWQFQPSFRSGSWDRTLREQRRQVVRKLKETPSLGTLLDDADWNESVWGDAVTVAIGETGLDSFPDACPWHLPDLLAKDWLPPD